MKSAPSLPQLVWSHILADDNNPDVGISGDHPATGIFTGTQVATINGLTDTNGQVRVKFSAGSQPGNNYHVAAALSTEALDGWHHVACYF